jgi:pentose-5-phosphate-3-epimerase/CBS domain-containing protein
VFEDMANIRTVSKVPMDLHIIAPQPEVFYDKILEGKIEQVAFQWEDIEDKEFFIAHRLKTTSPAVLSPFGGGKGEDKASVKTPRIGIALTTETKLPSKEILSTFNFVLLMCTVPGESGGVFDNRNLSRIIQLKYEHPQLKIHVDGGVNNEIAFVLRLLGVDLIVSGSYLMNHELLASGMLNLMRTPDSLETANHIAIKEFMIPKQFMPVLKQQDVDFKKVLQTIEQHKLGFVLIENGQFEGVVTNADIRRGLIQKIDALNDIAAADLINTKPVSINENASLNDLLKLIRHLNFIILFLPVVDDNNHLKGAILLNNLLRG